jgi:hypothetical protein
VQEDKNSFAKMLSSPAGPRLATILSLQEPEGISGVAGHFTKPEAFIGLFVLCLAFTVHSRSLPVSTATGH